MRKYVVIEEPVEVRDGQRNSAAVYPNPIPRATYIIDFKHQAIGRQEIDLELTPAPIIIVLLIPLALRGVKYRPIGAGPLLRRALVIYGAGGIVAPFVGIKLIDLALQAIGLA